MVLYGCIYTSSILLTINRSSLQNEKPLSPEFTKTLLEQTMVSLNWSNVKIATSYWMAFVLNQLSDKQRVCYCLYYSSRNQQMGKLFYQIKDGFLPIFLRTCCEINFNKRPGQWHVNKKMQKKHPINNSYINSSLIA